MKATTPQIKPSIGSASSRFRFILVLTLASFALLTIAQAVSPPPDGGYPGGNTAEGQQALFSVTTGTYNTAVGFLSLRSNSEGQFNTAIGAGALLLNRNTGLQDKPNGIIDSSQNTAVGAGALLNNTTGANNTANGAFALFDNTTGQANTASGVSALLHNITGTSNTADGANALDNNTTGIQNTANGAFTLFSNTEGTSNTASGDSALYSNTTGGDNIANGALALFSNTEGGRNTATGASALHSNTEGSFNTAIGYGTLMNSTTGAHNTAVGHEAFTDVTGSDNTALGDGAGFNVTTASNVICIGSIGGANIDNSCFIGNIYSNIQPVIGTDPDYVTITSNGRLGRSNLNGSSRRFKHDIKPMDKASEVIFALRPVSFRYNKEYDSAERPSFGLIAEEVAQVDPDLVGRNRKGESESVRYEQINAMLLNEFLKEHKAFLEEQRKVQDLERGMAALSAQLKEQAGQIQKVTAVVDLNKAATNHTALLSTRHDASEAITP